MIVYISFTNFISFLFQIEGITLSSICHKYRKYPFANGLT